MKRNIIKFAGIFLAWQMAFACMPDDEPFYDNSSVDLSAVDSVVLIPNHVMVLADGHARLELMPRLYKSKGAVVPDDRLKEEWFEYTAIPDVKISRYFSTTDLSLIGKKITVRVGIKGTKLVSSPVTFEVVAPLHVKYCQEIKVPVIFHIVQTDEDVDQFGGEYTTEKISLHLLKLNNLFSGVSSVNPVGVNTHVRFEPALYTPEGKRLLEPGIQRIKIKEIDLADGCDAFIQKEKLFWPADKYMNIWLISDRQNQIINFVGRVTMECTPHYIYPGVSGKGSPKGIIWEDFTADRVLQPKEAGLIFRLQDLDKPHREFKQEVLDDNELSYYVGRYFGLLPTWTWEDVEPIKTDFCGDTHKYRGWEIIKTNYNIGWYKEADGCYFKSENIADDPSGVHISVSKDQCLRIRWVLENCPERSAWKSEYAFTGKEEEQ